MAQVCLRGSASWLLISAMGVGVAVQSGCSASEASSPGGPGPGGGTNGGSSGVGGQIFGGSGAGQGGFNVGGQGGASGGSQGGNGGVSVGGGKNTPSNINECPGPLSPGDVQALQGGGAAGGMRWLYPYDSTVFPRGLLAPSLQWEGPAADAVYVRMQSNQFLYEGCFGTTNPLRVGIPQLAWDAAGEWSAGPGDPLVITVSTSSGGSVTTIQEQVIFALATIKGAVYYNTYTSPLANLNGAVMKVVPGQAQPQPFLVEPIGVPPLGPCFSCHALSADGSTMFANRHSYPLGPYESFSFDVTAQNAQQLAAGIPEAGFAGVFPDGSRAMTNGPPESSSAASGLFPWSANNVPALIGPAESHLIDSRTGQRIPAAGWDGEVLHAQMPMFSPDGKHLVYNDADQGGGHALWVADFDAATNTFSNKREIFRDGTRYPAWPFFTPDSAAVVFALGTRSDFASQVPDRLTLVPDQVGRGSLHITYLNAPGSSTPLDLANGYRNGNSYLPEADNDYEFYPTVSPIAAGGYFWAFFTSRRTYGNIFHEAPPNNPESKKIWVAAISIGGQQGMDASHPAFFLPGQEIESGNVRAFAALEPCKEDGSSCTNGTECCVGFCINGVCMPPPPEKTCSELDERCESSDDCCDPSLRCIGGYCARFFQ